MSRWWKWYLPGYLLLLPMTLGGCALALFVYRATFWRWHDGCLEVVGGRHPDGSTRIWGKPGAQTLGAMIVYADIFQMGRPDLRVHERVHVVQGMIGGPLFALAYGLSFLAIWVWRRRGWKDAYYAIPFERQAYRIGDRATGWGS